MRGREERRNAGNKRWQEEINVEEIEWMNQKIMSLNAFFIRGWPLVSQSTPKQAADWKWENDKMEEKNNKLLCQVNKRLHQPSAPRRVLDLPVPVTAALWTLITTLRSLSTTLWTPCEPIKDALTSPRAPFKLRFPRQALNAAQRPSCHPNWHQNLSNRTATHGGVALWFGSCAARSQVQSLQWSVNETLPSVWPFGGL